MIPLILISCFSFYSWKVIPTIDTLIKRYIYFKILNLQIDLFYLYYYLFHSILLLLQRFVVEESLKNTYDLSFSAIYPTIVTRIQSRASGGKLEPRQFHYNV